MRLAIWNAEGVLAREFNVLGRPSSPGVIKNVTVFRDLVAAEPQPFVLLWHTWQKTAFPILGKISTDWPRGLEGCVLFSSGKYANGPKEQAQAFLNQHPHLRGKVHVCSSYVSSDEPEPAVVGRFKAFAKYVSRLDGVSRGVEFDMLEPPSPKEIVFTAQMACLIDRAGPPGTSTLTKNCLDWPSLSEALGKPVDSASLVRIANTLPDEMECPLCEYRITITHPLKSAGNPIPLLRGDGAMTLRKLLAIDRTAKLNGTLESSLRTTLSCSRSRFLKLAVEVLESIFNNGCALFCRREELTRLCEQVEALLAEGADRAAFRPVVDEIKRTLSCGGVIDAHKKIRLQERLKKR